MPNGKRANIPAQSLYDLANIRGQQQFIQQAGQMATQPGAGGFSPYTAITGLLSGLMQRRLGGQQADIMAQAQQQQEAMFGQIEDIIDMDLPPEKKIEELVGMQGITDIATLPQIVSMLVKTKGEKIKNPTPQQIMAKLTRLSRQPTSLLANRKIFLNPATIANRKAQYNYYYNLGQQYDEVKKEGFLPTDQVPWSSFGKSVIEPTPPAKKKGKISVTPSPQRKVSGLLGAISPITPTLETKTTQPTAIRKTKAGPPITQVPAPTPAELAQVEALMNAGDIDGAESLIESLAAKYPGFSQ